MQAASVDSPAATLRCGWSMYALFVRLSDGRRKFVKPATGSTQSSEALSLCFLFFAFALSSFRLAFLLF